MVNSYSIYVTRAAKIYAQVSRCGLPSFQLLYLPLIVDFFLCVGALPTVRSGTFVLALALSAALGWSLLIA